MKLFPRDCTDLVLEVQGKILEKTGKHVEVMVYGDGAFKDPVGKITGTGRSLRIRGSPKGLTARRMKSN